MGARGPNAKPTIRPKAAPAVPRRAGRAAKARPVPEASRADRLIAWIQRLTVTSGHLAGQPFRLLPWQRDVIQAVYATDDNGSRPCRTALVSCGRKSGKTTFAAALALAHLAGPEAIPRGLVVSAAADRPQAALVFNEMVAFAAADEELRQRINFRHWQRQADDRLTGSTYAALSADQRKAVGISPSFAICDELAVWRGSGLIDALRSGQGAHLDPLLFCISTRSPDPDSPLEEMIRYAADVGAGTVMDPSFKAFIWSADPAADPFAPATWHSANPGLVDGLPTLDSIAALAGQARNMPSALPAFRAYCLNLPVRADGHWIAPHDWDSCAGTMPPSGRAFLALDLSGGAHDLTALVAYWPDTGTLRTWGFIPDGVLAEKEREDRAPYSQWADRGFIVVTPGRAIDKAWLATWIAQEFEQLDIAAIACDRWGLADLQAVMAREGLDHLAALLVPVGQGYKDMSPLVRGFEAAILNVQVRHGGNPLLRWCVANALVTPDPAGNVKLDKSRSRSRIDAAVAAVMAVGIANRAEAAPTYEFSGWL